MKDGTFTADRLLALYDRVAEAEDAIPRLRRFVLDLAVRGKLVEQDPTDEPASELLKWIAKEKARLVKAGEIRKPRDLDDGDEVTPSFDLPESWRWCRLDTVGAIIGGGTPSATDSSNFAEPGEGFPWLTPADLGGFKGLFISKGARDLTEKGLASSSATPMPAGSVLFTSRAPIGYVAIAANPISTNQGFKSIVPYVAECSAFIALAMKTFAPEIDAKAPGTTFKEVSGKIVAAVPFPLPPLAEQQRIVAKVDELMALCDRLQAARAGREAVQDRLTAATLTRLTAPETDAETFPTHARFALQTLPTLSTRPDQIKTLRQTILNLAVRGKLVAQDPTDEPAAELLKRIAQERKFRIKSSRLVPMSNVQATSGLPYGWSEATFSDLSIFENGDRSSNYPSGSDIVEAGVPFFSTKNISDFRLNISNLDHITEEKFASLRSGKLQDRDILITLRGSVGKFGLFRAENGIRTGFINAQLLIVRSLLPELVEFLLTFMKSDAFAAQIDTRSSGSATPQLSAGQLGHVNIPLPPLAEQHRIVAKVDALMALCDQLETSLTTATTTRSRLLESLLHEALGSQTEAAA